jgi:hypothetical protein
VQSKDEGEYEGNLASLKNAESELNFVQNKIDQLAEFEKIFSSSDKRAKFRKYFSTLKQFKDFLYGLPYN